MTFFLIAGEASGDLHASHLIHHLRLLRPEARFVGLGGDLMRAEGLEVVQDYRKMAFMGILPVLMNLSKVGENFRLAKEALMKARPDVLILIDYPSFNLKMAKFAKQHLPQTRVVYYISPKLWAWKTYRIRSIRRYVDRMYTIFPFETDFYRRYNYEVTYVGNPLLDAIESRPNQEQTFAQFAEQNHLPPKPVIALLAGSRKQEISKCLPRMIQAASAFADHQLVIAGAPGQTIETYQAVAGSVPVVFGQTYELLQHATVAVVNSGTATLETALIGTPQVVVYNVAAPHLASLVKPIFIKTKYVSLVNIIAGHEVVRELVAAQFTTDNVRAELRRLLTDADYSARICRYYDQIRQSLGGAGAARTAAQHIVEMLEGFRGLDDV